MYRNFIYHTSKYTCTKLRPDEGVKIIDNPRKLAPLNIHNSSPPPEREANIL